MRRLKVIKKRSFKKKLEPEYVLGYDEKTAIVNTVRRYGTHADAIKQAQEALDMTQVQFAQALGVTARTVQYWESNTKKPDAGIVEKIGLMVAKCEPAETEHEPDTNRNTVQHEPPKDQNSLDPYINKIV